MFASCERAAEACGEKCGLVTPEDTEGPSRMMQAIGRRYVRYVDQRYRRTGTLWEGRFKSAPIDSEVYLLACSRYIELNPLRARMVRHPRRWSSYQHNADGATDAVPLRAPTIRKSGDLARGTTGGLSGVIRTRP